VLVGVRVIVGVLMRVIVRVLVGRLVVERMVGMALDEDIDFGGGDSAALDTMSGQFGVESETASDGL
jgi:hypothetical protein